MFDFEEELKNLPELPGVYIMHDKDDTIIYVGKAKILKNRVRQYFQKSKNHTPKVLAMVSNVAYFEYIVTDSEIEALVLECNLIKKHRPKYNILLKDDKQYPYIKVSINKDYPSIYMSRTLKNDGAKYFGPYTGMQTVRNTIDIVQKIFKPPTCRKRFPEDIGKGRPCLNYHINNCFAPCIEGRVSKEEYRKIFFDICAFLEGNHKELLSELQDQMLAASKSMEFEKAAILRDKIEAIKSFEQKQKIINADRQTDMDIIAGTALGSRTFIEVFFVRRGRITGHKSFKIEDTQFMESGEVTADFIKQFYAEGTDIPSEILTDCQVTDIDVISSWLSEKRGKKVRIFVPQKGEKKQLVNMVRKNADISADNYRISSSEYAESKNKISRELAKKLGLEKIPVRIESYDISNISGSDNVASMVVFENGRPAKNKYRHFKIKSFEGANDYQAMQEVIYRRLRRALEEQEAVEKGELKTEDTKFLPLPDLIFLDGGKGHISSIMEVMESTETDIPIFGMVKDAKHRTRGLLSDKGEIELSPMDSIFKFITQVQDEVHRSAITYHIKLRSKSMNKSELDEIKGIGKVKKAALMSHFKTIDKIKIATLEELSAVVDKRSAEAVFVYFGGEI